MRGRAMPISAGGGTPTAFQSYKLADASSSNGQSIVPGGFAAAGDDNEFVAATLTNGVDASAVGAMGYVEWTIKDALGADLSSISEIELLSALCQFLDARLPTGARIGVALTVGGMAAPDQGIVAGYQGTDTGVQSWHTVFTTSWVAASVGGANDKLARTAQLQVLRGNALTSTRISSSLRLADDDPSKLAATTSPGTLAAGGAFTKIALLFGTTGALGAAVNVTAAVKSFLLGLSAISGIARRSRAAPTIRKPSSGSYGIVLLGHSMAHATVVGNQASTAVNAGFTYWNLGTSDANWDAGSSPGHSLSAKLLDDVDAIVGNTGGYLVRRSASGAQLAATSVADGHLGDAEYDVADQSLADPDLVVVWYGANDANGTEQQSLDYLTALRRFIRLIRDQWPNAVIVLPSEHASSGYTYLPNIEAAKVTVSSEFDHVYHVIYDYQTAGQAADGIHPNADGYDAIGAGIAAFVEAL